jgi:CheY-like chemotaxis protein
MGKYILVVDDELDMRDYLRILLEDKGYVVRTASNGVEALAIIQENRPALVLLDLLMPAETGTGLYRKLHDHKELRDIPVVVVSGQAGRNVAVGRNVVVLDKPIVEDRVLAEVERVLGSP